MKKSELLRAIREEIQRHNLDTFMSAQHKIVQTGCSTCQKHFGTVEQFKHANRTDMSGNATYRDLRVALNKHTFLQSSK